MKITENKAKDLHRSYTITISKEEFEEKFNAKLQQIGKTAKIDGFRPGKVPAGVLKKKYGEAARAEVLEHLAQRAIPQALNEKKVTPATQPKLEVKTMEEDKDLEFTLDLEVLPELPELKVDNITLEKWETEVTEKDIDEAVDRILESAPHFEKVADDKAAKSGDAVFIDFVGKKDGTPFEGGTAEGFQLELGSGQFIPGFEEQLIGAKAGDDVEVKVTFPENYGSKDLAGADAVFDVTVHEVRVKGDAKLTDEFAKERFGLESADELKQEIRKQLENDYEQLARNKMKRELFDKLDKEYQFDVPEGMLKGEFDAIWKNADEARKEDPAYEELSDDELEKEFQRLASRRVRLGLLLADKGQQENIQISQQEVNNAIMQQARMFPGQEQQVMEFYQKNAQALEAVRGPIMEEKVTDLLLEDIKTKPKKVQAKDWHAEMESHVHDSKEDKPKKSSGKKKAAKKKSA